MLWGVGGWVLARDHYSLVLLLIVASILFFAFLFGFTTSVGFGPFFAATEPATRGPHQPWPHAGVTEALFGQMYLVTVVALLVSSFGRERHATCRRLRQHGASG